MQIQLKMKGSKPQAIEVTEVLGQLALHPFHDGKGDLWTLSHIKTGCAINHHRHPDALRALALRLVHLDLDSASTADGRVVDVEVSRQARKICHAWIEEHPDFWIPAGDEA